MNTRRSIVLLAAIGAMTPFQKDLFGTRQRSLIDIPSRPDTDEWYSRRAQERREKREAKRANKISA